MSGGTNSGPAVRITYFRGGVHPGEAKDCTRVMPIEVFPTPARVFLHLQQALGTPPDPLVKAGDEVKAGQVIAAAHGFLSVPLHSPVSGKVAGINPYPHPTGPELPAIEIESDGQGTPAPGVPHPEVDPESLDPEDIRRVVRDAGIVGLGGATFPAHVKLSPPPEKPIDTLILNGCECEPYLTADERLMMEEPEAILRGGQIIARLVEAKRIIIAIEADKPEAIRAIRKAAEASGRNFQVAALKVRYPQGAEKQLIKTLLSREVPSGGLPMDVSSLVHNVGTARAVDQAVRFGMPLLDRVVTVTGPGVKTPKNFRVALGTPVRHLLEACGAELASGGNLIIGGPMMGMAQWSLEVPITKGSSGVLFFRKEDRQDYQPGPCLRCGACQRSCPMGLAPNRLHELSERDLFDLLEQEEILDCIECGACAYTCPARLPLVQSLKYAKGQVQAERKKKQAANG